MDFVSSSTLYQLWYPSTVQPGVPIRRHGPAISHRLPSLQVFLYAALSLFVYLFSFWTNFITFFQHGPHKPLCVHDFQDVRTCEEELFKRPSPREQHQQSRKWSWQHSLHQWESWKKQLARHKGEKQQGINRGVWQQGFLNTGIVTIKSRLPRYKVQNF